MVQRFHPIIIWLVISRLTASAAWLLAPQHSVGSSARRSFVVYANAVDDGTSESKVLVLGGTGFVGRHVVDLLDQKNIPFIATSTQGLDGTVALDLISVTMPLKN